MPPLRKKDDRRRHPSTLPSHATITSVSSDCHIIARAPICRHHHYTAAISGQTQHTAMAGIGIGSASSTEHLFDALPADDELGVLAHDSHDPSLARPRTVPSLSQAEDKSECNLPNTDDDSDMKQDPPLRWRLVVSKHRSGGSCDCFHLCVAVRRKELA